MRSKESVFLDQSASPHLFYHSVSTSISDLSFVGPRHNPSSTIWDLIDGTQHLEITYTTLQLTTLIVAKAVGIMSKDCSVHRILAFVACLIRKCSQYCYHCRRSFHILLRGIRIDISSRVTVLTVATEHFLLGIFCFNKITATHSCRSSSGDRCWELDSTSIWYCCYVSIP